MSRAKVRQARRSRASHRPPVAPGKGAGWPWAFVIVAVTGLVIGGFILSDHLKKASAIDETTLCPLDGPKAALAILLDLTDPVTQAQDRRLRTIIGGEIARAEAGTMISVGLVSEDRTNWGAKFALCKPQEEANANPLIQNPKLIGERYNDEFKVPFGNALQALLKAPQEKTSPIMESLQALISDTSSIETVSGRRQLIIASDLLQNSSVLSFYRGEFWEAFAQKGGTGRLSGNLTDVDVMLLRIPRPDSKIDGDARVDQFWLHYFDRQGTHAGFDLRTLGDL